MSSSRWWRTGRSFIEGSVNEVRNTAIIGGLLAIVILFLFLRSLKSTAIIAVSIPISLIVTFAPLQLLGVSLNIMSLGGLALGIGMLVDSSIVVLESIFRCREEGDGVAEAAVRGTSEVRMAVIASTLTSIAVFLPMVFVEGVAGQAFGDLGLAVVISLLAALVVALTLIPMLASRTGAPLLSGDRSAPNLLAHRLVERLPHADHARSTGAGPTGRAFVWLFLPLARGDRLAGACASCWGRCWRSWASCSSGLVMLADRRLAALSRGPPRPRLRLPDRGAAARHERDHGRPGTGLPPTPSAGP